MKTTSKFYVMAFLATIALLPTACQSDDCFDETIEENTVRVPSQVRMVLNADMPSFEGSATRATSNDWSNGAKIYLQFNTGSSYVDGVATYNSSNKEWSVEYYGTIASNSSCQAYYFENAGTTDLSSIKLNATTAIYADRNGNYTLENGTLTVTATLKPLTGRIRFKGATGQSFHCRGFNTYNSYNFSTNSFESSATVIDDKVGSNGYSNYYYGFFHNESEKIITFDDFDNSVSFTKTLGANALAAGKSGYLDIPTTTSRSGWAMETYKADIAVTAGLVAYYPFDNSDADDAVGGYHGFMTGGTFITDTPNGAGKALSLKEQEYVTIGSAPLNGKRAITINLWLKDFGAGSFLKTETNNNYIPPTLVLNSSSNFATGTGRMYSNNNWVKFNPIFTSYQSEQWVMVSVVSEGSGNDQKVTLFINGRKVDTGLDGYNNETGNSMTIGGKVNSYYQPNSDYNNSWTAPFKIDNLRLHSVALTDDQIMEIYNAEKKQ